MAGDTLTLRDIYLIAVSLEEKGAGLYSRLEEMAYGPGIADMFHRLAEEEKDHARQIVGFLEASGAITDHLIKLNTASYLQALQGHNLQTEAGPLPVDAQQAILMGIQTEKDSILLYHELFDNIPPGEEREMVGRLLEMEKMHLVELRTYLEEM